MDIICWMNKLDLGDHMFDFVDNHYFKHLLFIKLTRSSNINIEDVKTCECTHDVDKVVINMTFKKKVNVPDLSEIIEENIHEFDFDVECVKNNMRVTIRNTKGAEVYSNANILNSYA